MTTLSQKAIRSKSHATLPLQLAVVKIRTLKCLVEINLANGWGRRVKAS
jgi:hypothetical protein